MLVAILTLEEKELIDGQDYDGQGSIYCPVLDGDGNWVITEIEIELTVHPEYFFLKEKELIEYVFPKRRRIVNSVQRIH